MRSDGASDKGNWAELIPHRDDLFLEPSFELLAEHVVVMERGDGLVRLSVCPQRGGPPHLIPFEEPVYEISLADNYEPDSRWLRFVYSSLTTPASTYDYDVVTRERILRKTKAVSEGFSPSSYRSERLWAVADDGTRIPISLVYHEDRPRDGGGPLLLTGYGAEASSSDADFDSARLSLLDRGFAFAIAHVRGGAELGHSWYEQARQLQKKNTFTDFIACAEYLVREKITSPNRLCVYGASAGGTLAAVVAGMRPDLFQAVVAEVPFVDVVTTMADESIPWVTEQRDEWGDPTTDQRLYRYMLEYSPYDQVENKAYPHLLVTVAANDPNVMFWEATKWVAKLRHERTDDKVLLLRPIDSHQGNPGRLKQVPDVAFMYAFLVRLAAESFTRNAAPD